MRIIIFLNLILLLEVGGACNCSRKINNSDNIATSNTLNKNDTQNKQKTFISNSTPTDSTLYNNYELVISFFSRGQGIDYKNRVKLDSLLEKEYPNKIEIEKISWGREGEVDYCLKLNQLLIAEQEKFIINVKTLLKESPLILIEEDNSCSRKNRNANRR